MLVFIVTFAVIFLTYISAMAESLESDDLPQSGSIIGNTREAVELPMPHNRFSTIVFRKQSLDGKSGENPVLAENPDRLHDLLLRVFHAKFESSEYIDWRNLPGIPKGIQKFPAEAEIKAMRAVLAKGVCPPNGTRVIVIPLIKTVKFTIDGQIDEPAWESLAAKIMIDKEGARTLLYLISDGSELFMACNAIDELTETGFDQFRFFFHLDTSPLIENERIHVGRNEAVGLRQTHIKWRKAPPANENERWKMYHMSDWNIYQLASGTSSFSGNRKYEAVINLSECGLHLEIPFSAFIEVESDPIYEAGNFKSRVHIGELGSQRNPVWFIIQKVAGEASDNQ